LFKKGTLPEQRQFIFPKQAELLAGIAGTLLLGAVVFWLQSPLYFFIILGGLVGVLVAWNWQRYFPLFLFLLLPFSIEFALTGDTRLTVPTEPFIPILFLLWALSTVLQGKIRYLSSILNFFILLFYLVTIGSLAYTEELLSTIKAIIRDTGYLITGYYLIPLCIQSEQRLKQVLLAGLGIQTLLVIYGFGTQLVMGFHVYGDVAYPFFIEHCIYAAFITISFCFLLAYMLDYYEESPNMLIVGATLLFALAIVLTFVRAAWLSVFVVLIFYLFQFRKRKASVHLLLLLIVGMMIGGALLATTRLGTIVLKRIDTITNVDYVANYDRLDRWTAAWHIWQDHPYLGVGWGAYPDVYFDYQTYDYAYSKRERMGAHNLYLELMAETGIVGLCVYLLMIYIFFRQTFLILQKSPPRLQRVFVIGMQGSMISYLFHAIFNNLGPSDKIAITFWFIMGMVPVMKMLADKAALAETGSDPGEETTTRTVEGSGMLEGREETHG
jgi:putative inorganic carbon (HCO3(-)) transporter